MEIKYNISPDVFKKYMMVGLGRTYLILQKTSNIIIYKDVVLFGCLNNISYDIQMEGTRANYVFYLMKYFNDDQFFESNILNNFNIENDYSTFCHLCDMLSLFYEVNHSELSKNTLEVKYDEFLEKKSYEKEEKLKFGYLCICLKNIGGIKKVRKICLDIDLKIGMNILNIDDLGWFFSSILHRFKGIISFINEKCDNYNINDIESNYLDSIDKEEREKMFKADYLVKIMKEDKWEPYLGFNFSLKASDEEKFKLINYLYQENNESIKEQILYIVKKGKFPITFDYLIGLYKESSDYLKHSILEAIINLDDERIKLFGYSLLDDQNIRYYGLRMICKLYDKSDRDILLKYVPMVNVTYEEFGWHSLYHAILDLFYKKTPDAPIELLTFMYENSLCSFCREHYVRMMKKLHILSNDLIEECLYDSNSDVNKFANKIINNIKK